MKILGTTLGRYNNEPESFICEISQSEMRRIQHGSGYDHSDGTRGDEVEICQKFDRAMSVLENCRDSIKIPSQLRSIAECLEIVTLKVEDVIQPMKKGES